LAIVDSMLDSSVASAHSRDRFVDEGDDECSQVSGQVDVRISARIGVQRVRVDEHVRQGRSQVSPS
jgi:hypothetical protein